jgi:hypothetical protein
MIYSLSNRKFIRFGETGLVDDLHGLQQTGRVVM